MITLRDILDQTEIEGAVRIQKWNDETQDCDVLYDINQWSLGFENRDFDWLDMEIKYIYPSTTVFLTENDLEIEVPQIVIEVE